MCAENVEQCLGQNESLPSVACHYHVPGTGSGPGDTVVNQTKPPWTLVSWEGDWPETRKDQVNTTQFTGNTTRPGARDHRAAASVWEPGLPAGSDAAAPPGQRFFPRAGAGWSGGLKLLQLRKPYSNMTLTQIQCQTNTSSAALTEGRTARSAPFPFPASTAPESLPECPGLRRASRKTKIIIGFDIKSASTESYVYDVCRPKRLGWEKLVSTLWVSLGKVIICLESW